MSARQGLALVRAAHTAIYFLIAAASFVVLFAALTGRQGLWLWVELGLVSVETVVFVASGMKCPLTALAVKYGASPLRPADTFLPESMTRHTLTIFGPLIGLNLALLAARWLLSRG